MKTKVEALFRLGAAMLLLLLAAPPTHAFSYQGVLSQNGTTADGQFQMSFQLLEAGTTTTIGIPITQLVDVADGLFQVDLPFDALLFDGTPYDLQITVGTPGGPSFVLAPPTPLAPSPQALFADSVGSVPDEALASNVARLNQPAVFITTVSMPLLRVSDPLGGGNLIFGPTDDCSLGIDPTGPAGLLLRDPRGIRILSPDPISPPTLRFGPTDDCSLGVNPAGPAGLLLRDPGGLRILSPNPASPPILRFGPTDDCSLGIDPAFPGLIERDPTGFRLLGQGNQGCRLIFGPTMDCTVEIQPGGPSGLLLRDPSGIRLLSPNPATSPRLLFGPTDDCSLGIDPAMPGLIERDPTGFRLLGQNNQGCRLIFGPTMDCTVEVDPAGPQGLLLRDPRGIRILPPSAAVGSPPNEPRIIFGPTDDCSIGIDPTGDNLGLIVDEPFGVRVRNPIGGPSRLILGSGFGNNPDNLCMIAVDPAGPSGIQLRDPSGVRLLSPPGSAPRLLFGPTDDCSLGIEPGLAGLTERDPTGFRLLGQGGQGCRLIFGPTMDCTVEVDPLGPPGLLLRDPNGIRILPRAAAPGTPPGLPRIIFGPTDDCSLGIDPTGTLRGLIVYEPNGVRFMDQVASRPRLIFGPTDDCSIGITGGGTTGLARMTFKDINPFLFTNSVEVQGTVFAQQFVPASTRRLKDNIKPLENALELIQQLQGVRYDWIPERGGKPDVGFIAEEVGKIFPELVEWETDGVNARGVNYDHLVAVAVEGIKAQQAEIETLREEKADMEARLARLEALVLGNPPAEK